MSFPPIFRNCAGHDADFLVDHFFSSVIGHHIKSENLLSPEDRDLIFHELTRKQELGIEHGSEERLTLRREHLSLERLEKIKRPFLDEFVSQFRKHSILGSEHKPEPLWPDGKPFAVCATHDMDHVSNYNVNEVWRRLQRSMRYFEYGGYDLLKNFLGVASTLGRLLIKKHFCREPDRLAGVAEWMDLEARLGFRSTFFFFANSGDAWHPFDCDYSLRDRIPFDGHGMSVAEVMKEILVRGFEIGLHGSYTSATFPGSLGRQKAELESFTQSEILLTRQHYLQYDVQLTPALLADAGIAVDSTQGFNDLIGFRAGTSFPYVCWDWKKQETLPLLEVPLHIQDGPLLRASYTEDEAIGECLRIMDSVESVGGCLTILFHPHWLATDMGLSVYRCILEEARNRNAWGCSMYQMADWWLSRSYRILSQPECVIAESNLNNGSLTGILTRRHSPW